MLWMIGREIDAGSLESLATLARNAGATRILEIGTGAGDVTLTLAAVLPANGLLITMEADAAAAAVARDRFSAAGAGQLISVIVGEPSRFLHKIRGPFDVIVRRLPDEAGGLRERVAPLLRPGGILIDATRNIV